jgi:UDP-N-acetylmuramate--alanine ligase
MRVDGSRRVHFIGIGGAGMSAIAKVLLERGVVVSGSDLKKSRHAEMLEEWGAHVHVGHDASLIDASSTVVVSSAIPESNAELVRARELRVPVMSRGQALAAVLEGVDSVVVAGTHGKTTTTSMIAVVLRGAGWDPTYLIGGELNDSGTNARHGSGNLAVAESDESDGSFLLLSPTVAVITNVELDHPDYWKSLDELRDGFKTFMERTSADGAIVVPAWDPILTDMARATGRRCSTFGDGGRVQAADADPGAQGTSFRLTIESTAADVQLRVPGRYNVYNALAAAAACLEVGVDVGAVAAELSAYRGVRRRYHVRGESRGVTVIDDYAHHPSEVRSVLAAARLGGWHRVLAVFQPHRYSRTAAFAGAFGESFSDADRIVVTDVYGAGERPFPGVSGKLVADAVTTRLPGRPVAYLPHRADVLDYLSGTVRAGDAVLTLGAGDVTSLGEQLLARLRESE